jgi:hypothetical protein
MINFLSLIANLIEENAKLKMQLAELKKDKYELECKVNEMAIFGCTGLIEE